MTDKSDRFNGNLPETFWAWLAGFIDGDGSIGFHQAKHGQPRVEVQITQKNRAILDELVSKMGVGTISTIHHRSVGRIYFALRLGSKSGRLVCERVAPYLMDQGKSERCSRAIAWVRLGKGTCANSPEKNSKYSEAVNLYLSGKSSTQVAEILGMPPGTISGWVKRAGLNRSKAEGMRLRGFTFEDS